MKETTHELIIVIAERGYTGMIMDAARAAGANTKAKAITFSLPVTSTAGLRLIED